MSESHFLDTKGLICPEPVMMLHRAIRRIAIGEVLIIESTDPSSMRDIPKFCIHLGHELRSQEQVSSVSSTEKDIYRFEIIKG
jgi:tRNA 2-thiouridine synthesizing protein A